MRTLDAVFIKSAARLDQCPDSTLPEFAVIGRSNVGKSSVINFLTNQSHLAKASYTPGKTQLINFFLIDSSWYLVDLPGYGYAKYSIEDRKQRMDSIQDYFTQRKCLRRVFVLIDGSIPPQAIDLDFCAVLHQEDIRFDIIITKIDKATQKELALHTRQLTFALEKNLGSLPQIFLTSSAKKKWRDALLDRIYDLLW